MRFRSVPFIKTCGHRCGARLRCCKRNCPSFPRRFERKRRKFWPRSKKFSRRNSAFSINAPAATKIRIHGDYHLGQVLYTGKDFVILDFEGEPARPLSERKLKRSALRDVAGMMRSFQYAAYSALWQPAMRPEDIPFLERWADLWYRQMGSVFLQSYLKTTRGASFIPQGEADLQVLLEAYLLDKAVYEVGYELNHRPDWVVIPIRGIKHILATYDRAAKTSTAAPVKRGVQLWTKATASHRERLQKKIRSSSRARIKIIIQRINMNTHLDSIDRQIAAKHLLTHPFYLAWTRGELSVAALADYARQYYHHVAAFPTYLSAVHARCDDQPTRKQLLDNLVDEEAGSPNHPELWLQFAEGLGVSKEDVQASRKME